MIWVGFDPGGQNSFGWAVLRVELGTPIRLETGSCSNADAALRTASTSLSVDKPNGIGIDAPLFWVAFGDRHADRVVRKHCEAGGSSGTVGHVHSLRGAGLVQGVLAAHLAAERWQSALITEAHPKALFRASVEARTFISSHPRHSVTEHQRDAALAAYAAWAAAVTRDGWRILVHDEPAPFFPAGREVSYWFPATGEKSADGAAPGRVVFRTQAEP